MLNHFQFLNWGSTYSTLSTYIKAPGQNGSILTSSNPSDTIVFVSILPAHYCQIWVIPSRSRVPCHHINIVKSERYHRARECPNSYIAKSIGLLLPRYINQAFGHFRAILVRDPFTIHLPVDTNLLWEIWCYTGAVLPCYEYMLFLLCIKYIVQNTFTCFIIQSIAFYFIL